MGTLGKDLVVVLVRGLASAAHCHHAIEYQEHELEPDEAVLVAGAVPVCVELAHPPFPTRCERRTTTSAPAHEFLEPVHREHCSGCVNCHRDCEQTQPLYVAALDAGP